MKVTVIQRRNRAGSPLLRQHEDRGVGQPRCEICVVAADLGRLLDSLLVRHVEGVGAGEIGQKAQLRLSTQTVGDQIVGLRRVEGRNNERTAPVAQQLHRVGVVGIIRVD